MAGSTGDKFTDTFNSANPNSARVTSTRTAGATSLSCDNLAGWPATGTSKVHFATYKIDTNNAKVAGTQIDWYGLVSGNSIGSMSRLAGATDAGNAIGDVVEMMPTGSWGHDLFTGLTAEHNKDGTHSAVTATSLSTTAGVTVGSSLTVSAGTVTLPSASIAQTALPLGTTVQVVNVETGTMATGTTLIPADNTIPQNTEGDQYMSLAITPKSTSNILVIEVVCFISNSVLGNYAAALFQDSTANALATGAVRPGGAGFFSEISYKYKMAAGTTSATTFKVRAGSDIAGTTTFNGVGGVAYYGGTFASSITITEYKA